MKAFSDILSEALSGTGYSPTVKRFDQSTKTAQEAANAIGCSLGQIAKSIIFTGESTGKIYLVISRGDKRIDEQVVQQLAAEPIKKADAEYVYQKTGYRIGGVPPFGHREHVETILDSELFAFDTVWAAAGDSNSVFEIPPKLLHSITKGTVSTVR